MQRPIFTTQIFYAAFRNAFENIGRKCTSHFFSSPTCTVHVLILTLPTQHTAQWAVDHVNAAGLLSLPAASLFHDGCSAALAAKMGLVVRDLQVRSPEMGAGAGKTTTLFTYIQPSNRVMYGRYILSVVCLSKNIRKCSVS